jgi:hypothetical protein
MSIMSDIATAVMLPFCGRKPEPLVNISNIKELRKAYEAQSGETHWFDKETLDFFGSANLHVWRPGITVEHQNKAPENVPPYCVTAWVVYSDDDRITPVGIERFNTVQEARAFAEVIYDGWDSF